MQIVTRHFFSFLNKKYFYIACKKVNLWRQRTFFLKVKTYKMHHICVAHFDNYILWNHDLHMILWLSLCQDGCQEKEQNLSWKRDTMNPAYIVLLWKNHILKILMQTLPWFNIPFHIWHMSSSKLVSQFIIAINK